MAQQPAGVWQATRRIERTLARQELLYVRLILTQDAQLRAFVQDPTSRYLGLWLNLGRPSELNGLIHRGQHDVPDRIYRDLQLIYAGYEILDVDLGRHSAPDEGWLVRVEETWVPNTL